MKKNNPTPVRSKNPPPYEKNPPHPPPPFISCGTQKRKVLELLAKGGNAHSIAKFCRRNRSTIVQHLKELSESGLTKKENHLWQITPLGKQYLGGGFDLVGYERGGAGTTNKWLQDRAHNIKIKYNILEQPTTRIWLNEWEKNDKIRNNVFYSERFGEIVTTYTGKSLIFQLPILRFKNSEMAISEAGRIAQLLAFKYEKEVRGLKLGSRNVKAQLITQHHAIPQEPYAKFCHRHGISYKDDVLEIDASETPELEFIDPKKSHEHHNNYVEYVKDFATKEVLKPSDVQKFCQIMASNLHELSVAQVNAQKQIINIIELARPSPLNNKRPDYIG